MKLTEAASKNDYVIDEMTFGVCNVDSYRHDQALPVTHHCVNSQVGSEILQVPQESDDEQIHHDRVRKREPDCKVDDPDVFEFSLSSGSAL